MATEPASAEGVFVGACTMEWHVSFSPSVGLVPGSGVHTFSGGGDCIVNGESATLTLSGGTLHADPRTGFGCLAGVAFGNVQFILDVEGFPNPNVQLGVVNSGGVLTVVAFALLTQFEGVGELVQEPATTSTCATGGTASHTTWTGAMAFQDPDPPPVRRS
ncbi:MAG: hypothetical protein M3394_07370 [Actinomycetota bacterium]|nr:hypothetical protein [Actinomycetota bacterium]